MEVLATAAKPNVLIVDDTPENLEVLDEVLRPHYEVKAALSGEQALKLAFAGEPPDIVLLDVMMPGMDGHEVCRRLKADPATARIPIIFITALAAVEDERLGLELGAVDYITKPISPPIVLARVRTQLALFDQKRSLETMVIERTLALHAGNLKLEHEVQERDRAIARVEYLIHHDPLTSLPNRRNFLGRLDEVFERVQRDGGHPVGLLVVNLDRFQVISESLGAAGADRVIAVIADRLFQALRVGDTLARASHDEFFVMMNGAGQSPQAFAQDAAQISQHLLAEVRRPLRIDEQPVEVTASAGLSVFPSDAHSATELLRRADSAMLRAKSTGRDRFERYRADFDVGLRSRFDIEVRLRDALGHDQLQLFYQPLVDLESGRIVAAEGLVRVPEPGGSFADSATIFELAQESGVLSAVDDFSLRQACEDARGWREQGHALTLAVNVSPHQLRDPGYAERVEKTLDEFGIPARQFALEITEHALLAQTPATLDNLNRLRRLGVTVALDDFGVGYSSLSQLRRLPIDGLKIDRSFVANLERDRSNAAIVTAVIALAESLGLQVTAEGVETEAQRQLVLQRGCTRGQGFLFSAAVSAKDFAALLAQGALRPAAARAIA